MTLNDLTSKVQARALTYLNETEETVETFPLSIVDSVIEYSINESHFPMDYTEDKIAARLDRCVNAMAMACIEVYSKVGAEGEKAHSENAISRTYFGAWISPQLHDVLPNFVGVL